MFWCHLILYELTFFGSRNYHQSVIRVQHMLYHESLHYGVIWSRKKTNFIVISIKLCIEKICHLFYCTVDLHMLRLHCNHSIRRRIFPTWLSLHCNHSIRRIILPTWLRLHCNHSIRRRILPTWLRLHWEIVFIYFADVS